MRILLLIFALIISGVAAIFSVIGLSQLFSGAATAVIIMASVLEMGKIVSTTVLHNYWGVLSKTLRGYLISSVIILMLITSMGIYGFLSNAYQKTSNELEIHDSEVSLLETKKSNFENLLIDNNKQIDFKKERVIQLNNLRIQQESRLDNATTNRERINNRNDIKISNNEIENLNKEINTLNDRSFVLNDSINKYNVEILNIKSSSQIAGEIGPLKYISNLTGVDMDNVVNVIIILLIFVFDPLAISLLLTANKAFELHRNKNKITNILNKPKGGTNETKKNEFNPVSNIGIKEAGENLKNAVNKINDIKRDGTKIKEKKKININDIKEKKEEKRGFSVDVPTPKTTNSIERVADSKTFKNGDDKKIIFKRNAN